VGLADVLRSPAWRAVLEPTFAAPAFAELEAFLAEERARGARVLPPEGEIFTALEHVAPEQARVVILGQDPYPTPGHAHGLAFSYRGDGALPPSLVNVFREIEADLGVDLDGLGGDLTPWAEQGVLLLNTVLTVRAHEAHSHRDRGWEAVTRAVLERLAEPDRRRVFLLWGRPARRHATFLSATQDVLEAGHPSPYSVRLFRGCRHFSRANARLGDPPIRWADLPTR
jgi:uracil-DNA glycosylase